MRKSFLLFFGMLCAASQITFAQSTGQPIALIAGIGDTTTAFESAYQGGFKKVYAESGPIQMVKVGKSEKAYMAYDAASNFGSPARIGKIEMDTITAPRTNWDSRMSEREFYAWVRNILPRDSVLTDTYASAPSKLMPWTKRYHVFTSASLAAIPGAPGGGSILLIVNGVPDKRDAVGPFVIETMSKKDIASDAKRIGLKHEKFELPI